MSAKQTIYAGGIDANLAPDAFHRWATHYYKCKQDFVGPHKFSPVPYFLLCRAIELQIKSLHLKRTPQDEVKRKFGHDLLKAYRALSKTEMRLNETELNVLTKANEIYSGKGFEYFVPEDALNRYSRYPSLLDLDSIAKKLLDMEFDT